MLAVSWLYAALVLVTLGMIRVVGDDWWVVDVLLLMPRWLFLGPVALLAAVSGWRRCFGHWALQAAIALVVALGFASLVKSRMLSRRLGLPINPLRWSLVSPRLGQWRANVRAWHPLNRLRAGAK